ncbi:permease prefix domain 1-containing protein [Brevibacillus reuszeri]|uniref:permease prefix domain 1-containing protein n=1 Tax=Brevibacillus reuszeri TaxID=54915 RepID=UPI0028A10314|nr:permease prefix domain 1-containing protein [Brevibacillus reuszeri]
MERLHKHVDQLFAKYKSSKQVRELKREILSNLEAKVADLTAGGLAYNEAIDIAKRSITSIDDLIDDQTRVYVNQMTAELVQKGLLYFLIAWIVTMPFRIVGSGILLNELLLLGSIVLGIVYLVLRLKKQDMYLRRTATFDVQAAFRRRKLVWAIWVVFITVSILYNTAMLFGSNIWFQTQVKIAGPYHFAMLGIQYALPFVSLLIPILFHIVPGLMMKYEAGEYDGYEA